MRPRKEPSWQNTSPYKVSHLYFSFCVVDQQRRHQLVHHCLIREKKEAREKHERRRRQSGKLVWGISTERSGKLLIGFTLKAVLAGARRDSVFLPSASAGTQPESKRNNTLRIKPNKCAVLEHRRACSRPAVVYGTAASAAFAAKRAQRQRVNTAGPRMEKETKLRAKGPRRKTSIPRCSSRKYYCCIWISREEEWWKRDRPQWGHVGYFWLFNGVLSKQFFLGSVSQNLLPFFCVRPRP